MELQVFIKTITAYNIYVDAGYDSEFEELSTSRLKRRRCHATPSKTSRSTMGGLKIDTETHVINKQGQAIQGLYAAGRSSWWTACRKPFRWQIPLLIFSLLDVSQPETAIAENC